MAAPIIFGGLAGLQLIGGHYAAKNTKETAALNADIEDMNAEFAELDAYDARIDGFSEQARYQSVVDKTLGEQTAILAAQDIDLSAEGTAQQIQKETRFIAELNKLEIQNDASQRALGYKREARGFKIRGFLERLQGNIRASDIKFQTLLSAAETGISGYEKSR